MATTVFTADVVTYDFLPEKYAEERQLIVAELNIVCDVDWQSSINAWYKTADSGVQGALVKAQSVHFGQTDGGDGLSAVSADGTSMPGTTPAKKDEAAQKALRDIIFEILTDAEYYTGKGGTILSDDDGRGAGISIAAQFRGALASLLQASTYNNSGGQQNALEISIQKVQDDLKGSGTPTSEDVPVDSAPTSKLRNLVNAWAFVPVMNRLVAGGNFTDGVVDGGTDTPTPSEYEFDLGETFDGAGDLIDTQAHLVFPVRILFADDGEANVEGNALLHGVDDETYDLKADESVDDLATTTRVDSVTVSTTVYVDDVSPPKFEQTDGGLYVKVGAGMYALKSEVRDISTGKTGGRGIAFQLNIIFGNTSPNILGAMVGATPVAAVVAERTETEIRSAVAGRLDISGVLKLSGEGVTDLYPEGAPTSNENRSERVANLLKASSKVQADTDSVQAQTAVVSPEDARLMLGIDFTEGEEPADAGEGEGEGDITKVILVAASDFGESTIDQMVNARGDMTIANVDSGTGVYAPINSTNRAAVFTVFDNKTLFVLLNKEGTSYEFRCVDEDGADQACVVDGVDDDDVFNGATGSWTIPADYEEIRINLDVDGPDDDVALRIRFGSITVVQEKALQRYIELKDKWTRFTDNLEKKEANLEQNTNYDRTDILEQCRKQRVNVERLRMKMNNVLARHRRKLNKTIDRKTTRLSDTSSSNVQQKERLTALIGELTTKRNEHKYVPSVSEAEKLAIKEVAAQKNKVDTFDGTLESFVKLAIGSKLTAPSYATGFQAFNKFKLFESSAGTPTCTVEEKARGDITLLTLLKTLPAEMSKYPDNDLMYKNIIGDTKAIKGAPFLEIKHTNGAELVMYSQDDTNAERFGLYGAIDEIDIAINDHVYTLYVKRIDNGKYRIKKNLPIKQQTKADWDLLNVAAAAAKAADAARREAAAKAAEAAAKAAEEEAAKAAEAAQKEAAAKAVEKEAAKAVEKEAVKEAKPVFSVPEDGYYAGTTTAFAAAKNLLIDSTQTFDTDITVGDIVAVNTTLTDGSGNNVGTQYSTVKEIINPTTIRVSTNHAFFAVGSPYFINYIWKY